VHFVGRLATYKYYNMDQIVAQALTVYAKITKTKRQEAIELGQIELTPQPQRRNIEIVASKLASL
jgi:UDP-galactopyranose mutase